MTYKNTISKNPTSNVKNIAMAFAISAGIWACKTMEPPGNDNLNIPKKDYRHPSLQRAQAQIGAYKDSLEKKTAHGRTQMAELREIISLLDSTEVLKQDSIDFAGKYETFSEQQKRLKQNISDLQKNPDVDGYKSKYLGASADLRATNDSLQAYLSKVGEVKSKMRSVNSSLENLANMPVSDIPVGKTLQAIEAISTSIGPALEELEKLNEQSALLDSAQDYYSMAHNISKVASQYVDRIKELEEKTLDNSVNPDISEGQRNKIAKSLKEEIQDLKEEISDFSDASSKIIEFFEENQIVIDGTNVFIDPREKIATILSF